MELLKKSVVNENNVKFTNFYIKLEGVDKLICIKPTFKESKADYYLLKAHAKEVE